MNGKSRVKCAGGVLAVLLLSTTALQAACSSPGFNPSNVFCDGCRYEAQMTVTRNEACHRPYRAPDSIEKTDHRMVKRARHGIAGLNGNTFAYMPSKDFVGKDDFTIEVLFKQNQHYVRFFVHWNVIVQ